jgi:pimeloyl-ACP methyl ester carboxylesterase
VVKSLAADYRVIAFDARGHGKSGKPRDPNQYGIEMIRDVVRLLDHLAIPKAHIMGYSMGANTTAELLTTNPERFLTAVLGAGAGRYAQWTDADRQATEQEAVEREKECTSRSQAFRLAPPNGPRPSDEELKRRSDACFADPNQDRFALAALARGGIGRFIDPTRAAAVTVPTLAIGGTLDPVLARLEGLKKVRPSLQLVVIDGAVHSSGDPRGAMRHPRFIGAVREFIAAQGRSTQP